MVFPASVTPFDEKGRVDALGVAKLIAWFQAAGCQGIVWAGTNGEGPSLSAVEKRDLMQTATQLRDAASSPLEMILGVSTPSLDEAVWLSKQAHNAGGKAILLMAPGYFREATEAGIEAWFRAVLDRSPSPVLLYNFPQRTGFTLSPELVARLATHERVLGLKDSSWNEANLVAYREALPGRELYVGNETLLPTALAAGWTGTISGAANVIPEWLHAVLTDPPESSAEKFAIILPLLEAIRRAAQPAMHKALLHAWAVLPRPDVRLPLLPPDEGDVEAMRSLMQSVIGRGSYATTVSANTSRTS